MEGVRVRRARGGRARGRVMGKRRDTTRLFAGITKSRVYFTVVIKTSQSDAIERLVVTLC